MACFYYHTRIYSIATQGLSLPGSCLVVIRLFFFYVFFSYSDKFSYLCSYKISGILKYQKSTC